MQDKVYLVLTEDKIERMQKTKPLLRRSEHAVAVNVEIDGSYFRSAIPEMTVRVGQEDMISPEVGMVVEEPEEGEERVVKDPGQFLEELYGDVLSGEEVRGIPKWAHDALVARLRELDHLQFQIRSGLTQGPEPEEAVYRVVLDR